MSECHETTRIPLVEYPTVRDNGQLLDRSIEVSGLGIANAKIIGAPAAEDGWSVIEFDATLN